MPAIPRGCDICDSTYPISKKEITLSAFDEINRWGLADAYPESVVIRELRAGGKVLVTTLTCPLTYPKEVLKRLYRQRWSVELDIRDIKTTMGMDILSCKSPEMIEKEIWVYLLAYNLIRLMMVQSAMLFNLLPRAISFKHTLQLWLAIQASNEPLKPGQYRVVLHLIAQQKVENRPGRIDPRAVKRRPKPIALLMTPRPIARQMVEKYGHPKKRK